MTTPSPLQSLWQAEPAEFAAMDLAAIHARAKQFGSAIRRRDQREHIAVGIVIAWFSYYLWASPELLLRLGSALTIIGSLVVAWQLGRRSSASLELDEGANIASFYRSRLSLERDSLATVALWYIGPIMPGMIVFLVGKLVAKGAAMTLGYAAVQIGSPLPIIAGIWLLNRAASRKLQREIGQLDRSLAA